MLLEVDVIDRQALTDELEAPHTSDWGGFLLLAHGWIGPSITNMQSVRT